MDLKKLDMELLSQENNDPQKYAGEENKGEKSDPASKKRSISQITKDAVFKSDDKKFKPSSKKLKLETDL